MTEQQIKSGYQRLDEALAGPPDALVRVERRMKTRRRRRRTALAGGSALGVLVVSGVAVAALSGNDEGEPQVAVDPGTGPRSSLVLTRDDGTTIGFPAVTVSCEPPVTSTGQQIDGADGRIWMYSPINVDGPADSDDATLHDPFVYFEGTLTKVQGDRTFRFPNDRNLATGDLPMIVFSADPGQLVEGRPNETSSQEVASKGTVHVLEASCDPEPVLRLEVDMTLASEAVQGPALRLTGVVD